MKTKLCLVIILALVFSLAQAQEMPKEYQEALTILGNKGDYKDGVFKVGIPRNDLRVTVAGIETPTAFGFGGWLAMTKGDGSMDIMMGDLVLLEDEVNPVMSALLDHGLEVTALHNHFFWEQPRLFYMHVHGHGAVADLARKVKPALDLIGHIDKPVSAKTDVPAATIQLDVSKLEKIIGHKAEQGGGVVKFTMGRDDLQLKEMGATINSRMGLNTWAAFVGTDSNAAVAGDVAMLESEVNPVLKALRKHGLNVVAIHHHMLDTHPPIIFLHYWGVGPAEKLAAGFAAALHTQRASDLTVDFDDVPAGKLPASWRGGVTGGGSPKWSVEADESAPSQPNVLKQSGEGTYPWCVKKDAVLADGFVEVKFKPMAGKEDQAGGVVWRWKDGDNYYVARANALEDNVRIYHVTKGARREFKSADVKVASNQWHTLRAEFAGKHFTVTFDGKKVIEADDDTIKGAGAVGVWTKADSVTVFDDFNYGEDKP